MKNSGCEDSGVVLDVNADAVTCQFERGAYMTASFGGRSAEFTTYDPSGQTQRSRSCSAHHSIPHQSGVLQWLL